MLRNFIHIALRNLRKHPVYTGINLIGMAVGIACCLLILLFVADERSYDRDWPEKERIFRMSLERIYPDRRTGYAIVPPSYAQSVKNECPEVEAVVRIADFNNAAAVAFKVGDRIFEEKNVLAADSTFFKVFNIPMLHGNPDQVLTDANGVVLSESTARRFFGKTDVVGQILQLAGANQPGNLPVVGVCADVPGNTHFRFSVLLPTVGLPFLEGPNHISFAANTYFLLKPGTKAAGMEAKFPDIVEKYAAGEIQRNFGVSWTDYKRAGNGYRYYLTALTDIHLHSNLEAELQPPGNAAMVNIFTIVALFILGIACFNFMNLATARSTERAREVGIRKTLGSNRLQLTRQFLTEAVLLSAFSTLTAVGLAALFLPVFNELAGKTLSMRPWLTWLTLPALLGFASVVGLFAGSYPAGVLSGFQPIAVLKGKFSAQRQGAALRNGLVVFQFAISICMIIATLVVFSQMDYIAQKQLGFQKEQVVTLANTGILRQKTEAFRQELLRIPGVVSVGGTSSMPGEPNYFGTSFKKPQDNETVTGRCAIADDDYVQTLGMELVAGRGFSKDFNDSLSVVLNERAVRDLGLGANPLGQKLVMPGSFFDPKGGNVEFTVVGVLRDFHFQSLHETIVPLFLVHNRVARGANNTMAVRVQPRHFQSFTQEAALRWKSFVPDQPFHFSFLDADLAALYASEQRTQQLFSVFALLAVFIACLGLFGLATHTAERRIKEIGIRKVLGASVAGVTILLAKDFLKLVLIALLIASPVAYYFMDKWLADFAYRIDLAWWMFAVAGVLAVLIAFLTVGFQSVKAALENPVKSLRSE